MIGFRKERTIFHKESDRKFRKESVLLVVLLGLLASAGMAVIAYSIVELVIMPLVSGV